MAITAALVKELRERTGAGMMDCKKALTECDGDMDKSIDWLREKGIAKAAKKESRIAAEGLSKVIVEGNFACLVEINTETDFVTKNDMFLNLLDTTCATILANKPADLEAALALDVNGKTLNDLFVEAVATIGEKITLRRFEIVEKTDADAFGAYMHNKGAISALVVLKNSTDAEFAKQMAMQVASMAPTYISRNDMPAEVIEHERGVQMEIAKADESFAKKPEKIQHGIIEGRISKALEDMSLVDQVYFLDGKKKCGVELKEHNTEVSKFVRFLVGEGLEKREQNFAEEVAKQING